MKNLKPHRLVATAPIRIFLQVNPDGDDLDPAEWEEIFPDESEVTWCAERVGGVEIEYIRADHVAEMIRKGKAK